MTASSTTVERRDAVAREYRDRLGEWLELHPADLGRIPRASIEALAIVVDAARYAAASARAQREENIDLREAARRLGEMAWHDPLTGLPNRRALDERLNVECDRANRYNRPLAVMIIDVDHLKQVNDAHGHKAGDELLRAVAHRTQAALRSGDFMGRLAGDEFLVICPETPAHSASLVAEKLMAVVSADQIEDDGDRFDASVSVGWANREGEVNAAEIIRAADKALYRAKSMGRGQAAGSTIR